MNKDLLKIAALIIVPFIVLIVVMYFAYPYLNEEKHQQVVESIREAEADDQIELLSDTTLEFRDVNQENLTDEPFVLQAMIDSLNNVKEELINEIQELTASKESAERAGSAGDLIAGGNGQPPTIPPVMDEAEFAENVKSLLNLDEEELAPIVSKLSNDHLVRLYKSAGNIQREKLLRSLTSERAASLMEKIML